MASILAAICILLQFSQIQTVFKDKISCHNKWIKYDLPSADGEQHFKEKSIFFIETSCKQGINSRQACSIESTARAHPKWHINVLFAGPVPLRSQKSKPISILKKYRNVKFFRIHVNRYGKGTPLASKLESGILNRSSWRVRHSADVLRFLTLYKYGGVYADLDVIVVKPFDLLAENWVAKEDEAYIGSAFLGISRDKIGRRFANATIRELVKDFNVEQFDYLGPALLRRVLTKICRPSSVRLMSAETCSGIAVYHEEFFYPVPYPNWEYYFKSGPIDPTPKETHAHHMWNYLSNKSKVAKRSPFAKLAKKYCPKVYKTYKNTRWTT